jgi:glycosyltransferase involved in cell wall biosynthesis
VKIAIATVQVPFTKGGAELHAKLLYAELLARGHEADIVTIPFKWYPQESLMNSMVACRMLDVTEVNGEAIDLLIAMKFPAYYLRHPRKVLWLCHQHRQAYDLWETEFGDLHQLPDGKWLRNFIIENDNRYIRECKKIFTNAENTRCRLKKFNDIDAVTLYHPPGNYLKLHCKGYEDFIFYPSRIDRMKRQWVLIEAARYLRSDTKIYLAGQGSRQEVRRLHALIKTYKLESRVKLLGFISEEEKIDYYARCLGVYFGAYDEDYGYVTLEAFYSQKPVIIHDNAGGPLEFVAHGESGFVVEENPEEVAEKIDFWSANRKAAEAMGVFGRNQLLNMNISWDAVVDNLLYA